MPNEEKLKNLALKAKQEGFESQESDSALEEVAELFEGKVNEVAPNLSEKAGNQSSGSVKTNSASNQNQTKLVDRELLRKKLLANAPSEQTIKTQITQVLEKEVKKLEVDITKFRKKKQYHLLSKAVIKLRLLARQLEEIAKMGIEQLKEVWLKIVHKFA